MESLLLAHSKVDKSVIRTFQKYTKDVRSQVTCWQCSSRGQRSGHRFKVSSYYAVVTFQVAGDAQSCCQLPRQRFLPSPTVQLVYISLNKSTQTSGSVCFFFFVPVKPQGRRRASRRSIPTEAPPSSSAAFFRHMGCDGRMWSEEGECDLFHINNAACVCAFFFFFESPSIPFDSALHVSLNFRRRL